MAEPEDFTEISDLVNPTTSTIVLRAGQLVGGRYEIISELGRGGMGIVYRVKQIYLNQQYAVKILDKRIMSTTAIRRFQQEARASVSLNHQSIIKVLDFGMFDDDTPFLAMELVVGETLADRLKRVGPMSTNEAARFFIPVCEALAYAHSKSVVHRDIKPSNIMIVHGAVPGTAGSVKIVDFGIAKVTSFEEGGIQSLTRTGEVFGSPLYMSPEQCMGQPVDHRADAYSLGCVMFEALTGAPPLMGDNALSTMMKHQNEIPSTLREASLGGSFPQQIENIVASLLKKTIEERPGDLNITAKHLNALQEGSSDAEVVVVGGARQKSGSQ